MNSNMTVVSANGCRVTAVGRLTGMIVVALALLCVAGATPAFATGAWWRLSSESWPAELPTGGEGTVVGYAENVGDEQGTNEPLTVTDRLPTGVVPQSAEFLVSKYELGERPLPPVFCSVQGQIVTCSLSEGILLYLKSFYPYDDLEVRIHVAVQGASSGAINEFSVSGVGATPTALRRPLAIGNAPIPFGVSNYELAPENADGSVDTQAGSHPFQLTTTFTLNQGDDLTRPPALAKDLHFNLPVGLIGNPTTVPQCSDLQFTKASGNGLADTDECGEQTAVGVADITVDEPTHLDVTTIAAPIFNLAPEVGEPARFGFMLVSVPVILDTYVRTGGDYGVTVSVKNISELPNFIASRVTFWGSPGDPRHDSSRGWSCVKGEQYYREGVVGVPCTPGGNPKAPPFLALPTSCTGTLQTSVEASSWEQPGIFTTPFAATGEPSLDGCNKLPFGASIAVTPDGEAGSTPTGLTVGVHVPQEEALNPNGLSPADVKDTTVTLPAGVALNPAAADGLQACSPEQIGLDSSAEQSCPESSKVGTLEIESPLLPNALIGDAYLAQQNENPFGSLVALYLVARDPVSGVLVKLAGEVKPDPVTGQLVSTFLNTPQLPFEDLKLHFFGGSRAPLATPALCGSYTTNASFAPWSGNQSAESSSTFQITSGPNGSQCADPSPFDPELTAGSLNIQAGGFTPFTMTMSRPDGQQSLRAISLHMPPGLSGLLSGVELCGEAQANAGTCGPNALIGETIVSVGVGGSPFSVKGGKVYLTGPYKGAPFGLSVVNPAKAGPYDLGQVVVRAKIEVDPTTADLTVTSDDTGPYKIPTMLDGIPLQIQHVNVTVNRPGFTFNPTDCNPMHVTGSISSNEGATGTVNVPFQVTNCATLAFHPGFKVSTSAKTSRRNGASLHVLLTYPKAPQGTQANIKIVHVELPRALPSRLSTLNHACPDSVFNQNPAACPAQSKVGFAKAVTPVLPVPLEGPAYFVSHGGQKFPELIVVLQGYGVTVYLEGETFINKAGVTSSTFKAVPDVPVGSFELTLPEKEYSALAANTNLCTASLTMPTKFTGQNGAVLEQKTKIAVSGCKPAIRVLRHKVRGSKAMIVVSVPSAGTLVASGTAIKRSAKRASKAGNVTIGVTLGTRDLRVLAKNRHQRVNSTVTLTFKRKHGAPLTARVKLLMG